MTGAFRDAPGSAAKTIKPEASHTKPGRTLLQVKTENKKNEVEERRAEENLMLMILAGGGRGQGSPILYIQTPDRPLQRLLLVMMMMLMMMMVMMVVVRGGEGRITRIVHIAIPDQPLRGCHWYLYATIFIYHDIHIF